MIRSILNSGISEGNSELRDFAGSFYSVIPFCFEVDPLLPIVPVLNSLTNSLAHSLALTVLRR